MKIINDGLGEDRTFTKGYIIHPKEFSWEYLIKSIKKLLR